MVFKCCCTCLFVQLLLCSIYIFSDHTENIHVNTQLNCFVTCRFIKTVMSDSPVLTGREEETGWKPDSPVLTGQKEETGWKTPDTPYDKGYNFTYRSPRLSMTEAEMLDLEEKVRNASEEDMNIPDDMNITGDLQGCVNGHAGDLQGFVNGGSDVEVQGSDDDLPAEESDDDSQDVLLLIDKMENVEFNSKGVSVVPKDIRDEPNSQTPLDQHQPEMPHLSVSNSEARGILCVFITKDTISQVEDYASVGIRMTGGNSPGDQSLIHDKIVSLNINGASFVIMCQLLDTYFDLDGPRYNKLLDKAVCSNSTVQELQCISEPVLDRFGSSYPILFQTTNTSFMDQLQAQVSFLLNIAETKVRLCQQSIDSNTTSQDKEQNPRKKAGYGSMVSTLQIFMSQDRMDVVVFSKLKMEIIPFFNRIHGKNNYKNPFAGKLK